VKQPRLRAQRFLDRRIEHRVEKGGPVPPPTLPLPWDAWLHMPKRQFASRSRGARDGAPLQAPRRTSCARNPAG